jgi:hypothetical protein
MSVGVMFFTRRNVKKKITPTLIIYILSLASQVYLQQNKKKEEAESKNCHAKTMLSLEI